MPERIIEELKWIGLTIGYQESMEGGGEVIGFHLGNRERPVMPLTQRELGGIQWMEVAHRYLALALGVRCGRSGWKKPGGYVGIEKKPKLNI